MNRSTTIPEVTIDFSPTSIINTKPMTRTCANRDKVMNRCCQKSHFSLNDTLISVTHWRAGRSRRSVTISIISIFTYPKKEKTKRSWQDSLILFSYIQSSHSFSKIKFKNFFGIFQAQFPQIQGLNKAQFETWIKVNYCYLTENFYIEKQALQNRLSQLCCLISNNMAKYVVSCFINSTAKNNMHMKQWHVELSLLTSVIKLTNKSKWLLFLLLQKIQHINLSLLVTHVQ